MKKVNPGVGPKRNLKENEKGELNFKKKVLRPVP